MTTDQRITTVNITCPRCSWPTSHQLTPGGWNDLWAAMDQHRHPLHDATVTLTAPTRRTA